MKTAVQFGAGNIGRGFIGSLLSQAGYRVVFADISEVLIPALKARGEYTVEIVGKKQTELTIAPVDGLLSSDPLLIETIAKAEIVTTAVGPQVLKHIAGTIARGIELRRDRKAGGTVNIIACENMIRASSSLKEHVLSHLGAEMISFVGSKVGFPDSAVDRIVPPMEVNDDPLRVRVEEFSEWIVDRGGFVGDIPEIGGMTLTDNLMAFIERKLFTLNTGHAITAYLGALHGHATIGESIADPAILPVVRGAMKESGEVLVRRYDFDRDAHSAYIEKILNRFRNPWLKDEVERVGRQPLRKLGSDDRFVKPLRGTLEYGTENKNLITGIAAALHFESAEDTQAIEMRNLLAKEEFSAAITRITSIDDRDVLDEIATAYRAHYST